MTARLPGGIEGLIRAEQVRSGGHFIRVPDLEAYLAKLASHAEFLTVYAGGGCRGLVAYYANDATTQRVFITLVLVAPEARGTGLGSALVAGTLAICRARGFVACQLEVRHDNTSAVAMYRRLGFGDVEDRGDRTLMEVAL